MSSFRHPEFEAACAVKRGDAAFPAVFTAFAAEFEREFVARPLAVGLEVLQTGEGPVLWVRVWVETAAVFPQLRRTGEGIADFLGRRRNECPRIFAATTEPVDLAPHVLHGGVDVAELASMPQRVMLQEFEAAAVQRVHYALHADDLQRWGESLGLGDELWCVTSMGGVAPVVFVQTTERAEHLRNAGTLDAWRDSYFELARGYDEFGVFSPDSCRVLVDSRETFETRYGSSWFAYWH